MLKYWRGGLFFLVAALFVGCTVVSTLPKQPSGALSNKEPVEIKGVDADGTPFKLSDYRGKVVMLDFWFKDCPWCVKMHQEDRILVERYKDKPFVLLGVNTDADLGNLRSALTEQGMTWRSWWDQKQLIAKEFGVDGYPTLFLIDTEGRVQKEYVGMKPADVIAKDIDKLLP